MFKIKKKLISFSLYGNNEYYQKCLIALLFQRDQTKTFSDWDIICYTEQRLLTRSFLKQFQKYPINFIPVSSKEKCYGVFWRFFPIADSQYQFINIRDIDSCLLERDEVFTNKWIKSNQPFHIFKDFYQRPKEHPIYAGCFGCFGGLFPNIKNMILNYISDKGDYYGIDENFLEEIIYPQIQNRCLIQHTKMVNIKTKIQSFQNARVGDRIKI